MSDHNTLPSFVYIMAFAAGFLPVSLLGSGGPPATYAQATEAILPDSPAKDLPVSSATLFTRAGVGLTDITNGSVSVADVDGQNGPDILVAGGTGSFEKTTTLYLQQSDGTYASANANLTDVSKASTSIADVDGQNGPDLLIAGQDADNNRVTTLYLQQSDGGFAPANANLTGVNDAATAIADVDRKNGPDLLVTGENDSFDPSGTLYLQQSDGSFSPANAGISAVGGTVSIADIDGQNGLDLLVTSNEDIQTTVYFQQSDGSFSSDQDIIGGSFGGFGASASVADVDGQNGPDILLAGGPAEGGDAALYLQQSDGSFSKVPESTAPLPDLDDASTAIADVDGQNGLDLVVAGNQQTAIEVQGRSDAGFNPTAQIYRQTSTGTFEKVDAGLTGIGNGFAAAGDVDGDGDADLLLTGDDLLGSTRTPSTRLYVNRSNQSSPNRAPRKGRTEILSSLVAPADTAFVRTEFGDLDGDRLTLQVTQSPGAGSLTFTDGGNGVGEIAFVPDQSQDGQTVSFTVEATDEDGRTETLTPQIDVSDVVSVRASLAGVQQAATSIADVNQDGRSDLLVAGNRIRRVFTLPGEGVNPSTTLYLQQPDGSFSSAGADLVDINEAAIAVGDVDGQNGPDVLLSGEEVVDPEVGTLEPTTKLYLQQSDGSFSAANANLTAVSGGSVEIEDFNQDGRSDLLVAGENDPFDPPVATLYLQQSDGSFSAANAGLDGLEDSDAAAADVDGQNGPDVFIAGDATAELYLQQSDGSFSPVSPDLGTLGRSPSVAVADVDGKNGPDLVYAGFRSALYLQQADGSFALGASLPDVGEGDVSVADFNSDSLPDFLLSGVSSETGIKTQVLLQQGDGSFDTVDTGIPGPRSGADLSVANIAGNDNPDILFAGLSKGFGYPPFRVSAALYENRLEESDPPSLPAPSSLTSTVTDAPAAELSWDAVGSEALARYRLYRSTEPITGAPSSLSPVDSVGAGTTSLTDTAAAGDTYYYRVTSVDTAGIESRFSGESRAFLYPTEVSAAVDRSFGDASDSTDYRLVALPGQGGRLLADAVGGDAGTAWQAYRDDGSEEDFLLRYDGSSDFALEAGNGFWLTATDGWTNDTSVSTVELRGDSAAVIGLRDGWNVISNPTDKDVPWSLVQTETPGSVQALFGFDGTFAKADTFRSAATGVAYYFFNDDASRDSLIIPYPGAPGTDAGVSSKTREGPPSLLALSARPAEAENAPSSTVGMGLSDNAKVGLGPGDQFAPPGRFAQTNLRLKTPDAPDSKRTRFLMTERRPFKAGGQSFGLRLTHRSEGPVRISAANLTAAGGRSVVLLHPSAGASYDLRAREVVKIDPEGETTTLKVAVGTEEFVEDKTEAVRPEEVRLTAYPNPVRKQGTIAYALPRRTEVTLRIYDVLGRQVATLATGPKPAGRHTTTLETSRLSSGVYFGRLRVEDQTKTLKITVVR